MADAFQRLVSTLAPAGMDDTRTALKTYYEVVAEFDPLDVVEVLDDFTHGRIEGQNLTFLPGAPFLAATIRKRVTTRRRYEAIQHQTVLQLEQRAKDRRNDAPEDVRQRIVKEGLSRLRTDGSSIAERDMSLTDSKRRDLEKHDAYFLDTSDEAITARLLRKKS